MIKKLTLIIAILVLPALAFAQSLGTGSIATNADGTTFNKLASSGRARTIWIINNTGTDIEVKVGAGSVTIPVYNGSGMTFPKVRSLADLSVRRVDTSATPVTVIYMYESD